MGRTERNGQDDSLRIAERYRLVEKLGSGGMSEVWRGFDETLGRSVAVKVLSPKLAEDQSFRDRLRQEALAAARLCHPHITGVYDFGESALDDRITVPFVVMELNDGESVAARVARQGPLSWRDAVGVAVEVASALATAHARGVVHRDVTPANVMLTGAGAKVVDFGISAIVGQRDAAPDGSLLGTPAYLAPERLGGSQVSASADVYALGLLLYRSLTGRLPWPAETTADALRAHLYADPEPLPTLPGMPPAIADLCMRCLTKSPEDRPGAAEVAHALAAIIGVQAVIPALPQRSSDSPATVRGSAPHPMTARPSKGRPALDHPATNRPASDHPASGRTTAKGPVGERPEVELPEVERPEGKRPEGERPEGERPERERPEGKRPEAEHAAACSETSADLSGLGPTGPIVPPRAAPTEHTPAAPGRSWLAYLKPEGRPSLKVLRLRARLKIGAALRRSPQPLGDGLFAGGGLRRPELRRSAGGRNRLQAGAVTLAVLAAAGISWATTRDTPDVREAQAAGAGVVAAGPAEVTCSVRYQLRTDSGSAYVARLTVSTSETGAEWRLQFSYPGTQRLTSVPKTVTQKGQRVTAKGSGKQQSFTLRGEYRDYNPLPLTFSVDDKKCQAEVLGSTPASRRDRTPAEDHDETEQAEAVAAEKSHGQGGGSPKRRKEGTPQKKAGARNPAPTPKVTTTAPASPPPLGRKGTGYSLAL
ncbi:serine/threonine-protein kinase [Paractinoplanes atraurantiacus]|uniref:non-specific serine/threonine protein kinase n=1 Tax=Paractinoplanes atraurantiacus TaxID=1036182 RepID=A0A285JQI1_9ACTN|nr:serine/threonine protein kinase [Actinoplanes atraurantiacus]